MKRRFRRQKFQRAALAKAIIAEKRRLFNFDPALFPEKRHYRGLAIRSRRFLAPSFVYRFLRAAADKWIAALMKENENFSVQIWLYERRFEKTQLVAAWGESAAFYDKAFSPLSPPFKPPRAKYGLERRSPSNVSWRRGADEDFYLATADGLEGDDIHRLSRRGASVSAGVNETVYVLSHGRVLIREYAFKKR